jgi:hypothetical protein
MIDNAVKMMVIAKNDLEGQDEYNRWSEKMKKYQDWIMSH